MRELQLSPSVLQRRVFNQNVYDLHSTDFMLGQTSKWLSKDKVTIDVGGAAGLYSTYFATRSKHVYAFEAVPPVFNQLNKLSLQFSNFSCYNLAVGNFDGKSSFWVDDKRLSNSGFQNLVNGQPIEIGVCKIDTQSYKDVGFIKVDVEGNEYEVLLGAVDTVDKYKPTCMIECYPKFSTHPCEMIYNFFAERGYNCAYNKKSIGLEEVHSVEEFSDSLPLIETHDGDYIFYHGNIPKE